MISMTGYGSGRAYQAAGQVTVQAAVVNHRHLQVHLRSDVRDVGLENALRSRVREQLKRGSVNVQVLWEPAQQLPVDLQALRQSWQELAQLAKDLGAPPPRLEEVARLQQRSVSVDLAIVQELAVQALDQALVQVAVMRQQEGAALTEAMQADAEALRCLAGEMQQVASGRVARYQTQLQERLQELVAADTQIAVGDLVRELAIYADRIDVGEELVRLQSHLEQLHRLFVSEQDEVGKRVEFLLQELGREVNTTGAKANDAELTRLVCEAKNVLERLREQAANLL